MTAMKPPHQVFNRKARRARAGAHKREARKGQPQETPRDVLTLEAPTELSLLIPTEESLKFFSELREFVDIQEIDVANLVELSSLRQLELGAALVLVAEFDRWQRRRKITLIARTISSWDKNVVAELRSLGFFRILGTPLPREFSAIQGKASWIQFVSDTRTIGKAAQLLRQRLTSELKGPTGYDQEIYVALVEAMKNAIQHAYPEENSRSGWKTDRVVGNRWWMAASIEEDGSLNVSFLDVGITIPRSLPSSWLWETLTSRERQNPEASLLRAVTYGISSTHQAHRGKGFTDIIKAASMQEGNYVTVVSGGATCIITGHKFYSVPNATPFAGTLITWHFEPMVKNGLTVEKSSNAST